ncbi:MAG: tetratricopeptide repeat protein, partial [Candidatus Cloacimonetes bacterium]|nr:tetratricopeptide repeat protein [Candidatus Cloacimonadota bacterium]
TASIIGKKFSYEMLLNMTKKNENELLDDLIDCREVCLIEESDSDYIFIHDKVREVLENEIKEKYPSFWKELHQKAGEFLEEKYSSNLDEVLDELANHFYNAEDLEKSIKYLELAGDKARKNFLNEKAIEHFDKLVKILEKEFAKTNKNDIRFDQMQKSLYDAYFNRGSIFYQIGKMDDALTDYFLAKKIIEQMNDKRNLIELLHAIGWCYLFTGDVDNALYYFEKELKITEVMNSKITLAKTFNSLSIAYRNRGNYEKHIEYNKRSLETLHDLDDDYYLQSVYLNLGIGYRMQGDYEKALECYHKSLKVLEKNKNTEGHEFMKTGFVLYLNFGLVQREQGNFDEAIKYYKKGMKISDEMGDKSGLASLIWEIGIIYYYKKKYEEALEYIDQAIKIQKEFNLSNNLYFSLTLKIDILFDQKKYSEIQKIYEALLKCLPKNLSYASEDAKVYQARISFHLAKTEKLKIVKGIRPLEQMLKEKKDEGWIAGLNYALWKLKRELTAKQAKDADQNRKAALKLYRKFYQKIPKIYYKNKIEELEKLN